MPDKAARHWLRTLRLSVLSTLVFAPLVFADEQNHKLRVSIHCDRGELVEGVTPRVLKQDADRGGLIPVDFGKATFDAQGEASLDLEPGVYVFEALDAKKNGLVFSLHSAPIDIAKTKQITIPAGEPQTPTLLHEGAAMEIEQLALRSVAIRGDARWKRTHKEDSPRIVLSPGQTSLTNIIASRGSVHTAAWLAVGGKALPRYSTSPDWNTLRFAWREKTPAFKSASAHLVFPDTEMNVEVLPDTRVITNRRFLTIGYTVAIDEATKLCFLPIGLNLAHSQQFDLGGELTPRARVGYSSEQTGSGWSAHFATHAALTDPGGMHADINAKDSGVKVSYAHVQHLELPKGIVDSDTKKKIGDPAKMIRATIEWRWGGPMTRTITPDDALTLRSKHFQIDAFEFWPWESKNYLSKMERYYQIEHEATGRPGPESVNIDWRWNQSNAKAIIGSARGGGKWLWLSVPFRGYETNRDPFTEPQFTGHELLHTFGYNHGDEMTAMQKRVEAKFADYRWYVIDHPNQEVHIEPGEPMAKVATAEKK
jgi:hypothetical protein